MFIEYMKFGKGDKTMLVLPGTSIRPVHLSGKAVENAFETFCDDFTIWLFDQREDISEGYSIEDMADDAYAKIIELGLKDIYLYGVSLGGMVAQMLMYKHPELIAKAAFISTINKAVDDEALAQWVSYAEKKDSDGLVEAFMRKVYTEEFCNRYLEMMKKLYQDMTAEEFEKFVIRTKAVKGFDLRNKDIRYDKPVMVLGAKADKVFAYEEMRSFAEAIGADSYFYEGYSHAVYDEAQDFRERVKAFYLQ